MSVLRKIKTAACSAVFSVLGFLLLYTVASGVSRYFVVHRLRPFIAATGILFLVWGFCVPWHGCPVEEKHTGCSGTWKDFIHIPVLGLLVFFVGTAVFHYEGFMQQSSVPGFIHHMLYGMTQSDVDVLLRRYPDNVLTAGKGSQSGPDAGTDTTPDHSLKTDSGEILGGYYPGKRYIAVSDSQLPGWMNEIAAHLDSYRGWTITMKGQVIKDPALFEPGTFTPARELMTCCIADLAPVGLTCRYDIHGPFAARVKAGAWVEVTGVIVSGVYEGETEPQVTCVSVTEAEPPSDPYVYP